MNVNFLEANTHNNMSFDWIFIQLIDFIRFESGFVWGLLTRTDERTQMENASRTAAAALNGFLNSDGNNLIAAVFQMNAIF